MPLSPVGFSSPFLSGFYLLVLQIVLVSGLSTEHVERATNRPPVDKSLLGIQIGSIAGAYLVFVATLLALLLFVGRRIRRTVQSSNYSLQMEMLQPAKSIDPSPISPMSQHIPSPTAGGFTSSWGSIPRGGRPSQTSVNGSMVTIDESVVASDRQRAQDQMEMLYAAVMEHDAQKASGVNISSRDADSQANSPDSQYTNPFTDRHASQSMEPSYREPLKSPKSNSSRLSKLFSSKSNSNPDGGKLRSPRFPVRKLGISSPLTSPDLHASRSYAQDQAPLSPRFYNPGPPPTAPRAAPAVAQLVPRPTTRTRAPPTPLNLSTAGQPPSNLPFRDAYPLQSAPATKTTILERPTKNRNGPVTGMPTPYSAYMPFTPVTPFTPGRMVTKRERRREERENGLRVLNEDDLVKDDDDVWG